MDKAVIEDEVLSSLPSVKDLARNFSNDLQSPTSPPSYNRPKVIYKNKTEISLIKFISMRFVFKRYIEYFFFSNFMLIKIM